MSHRLGCTKEALLNSGGGLESAYKPARVGLQRTLEAGHMRNPLQMRHLLEGGRVDIFF